MQNYLAISNYFIVSLHQGIFEHILENGVVGGGRKGKKEKRKGILCTIFQRILTELTNNGIYEGMLK